MVIRLIRPDELPNFLVSVEITDNDYDLSINKYKEGEYVAVWYQQTSEIIYNPEGKHDLMVNSLEKLGIRAKRGLLEWKECLIDFAEEPPLKLLIR